MATGDLTIFDEAKLAFLNGTHDLDTDVIKVAFINNTSTPTASTGTPTLGDFTEVSGGTFTAGGETMTIDLSEAGGTVTLDFTTNITNAKNAGNPTDVFWAIIYNDTQAGDPAIGFVEISASGFDATGGQLSLTWGSNIFTLS